MDRVESSLHNNQHGIISFLSVIFISLLLIIVTTGFVRVILNEQRQSTDFDQATKAYFAAEAGVENAVATLRSGALFTPNVCDDYIVGDPQYNTEVTCQIIDDTYVAVARNSLAPGESVTIDLKNADPTMNQLEIRWHQSPPALGPGIKATFATFPASGSFDSSSLSNKTAILKPKNASGVITSALPADTTFTNNPTPVFDAHCNATNSSNTGLRCIARINGLDMSVEKYVLNMKLFNANGPVNFEVAGFSNASPVSINSSIYGIDVTARAGDVYRRVDATYNTAGEPLANKNYGYDYVIFGDSQVCKNLILDRRATGAIDKASGNDPRC